MAKLIAMPTIRTALHFEAELGVYFAVVMSWNCRKGPLSDRAGFRMLEVHEFFFRFELPFWKKALTSPEISFPKTFASLDDIKDEALRQKKREQIETGIRAGYNELVKMSTHYFSPSNIFLILLLGKEGPCFCRALARLLQDKFGEWDLPEVRTQLEKDFLAFLGVQPESYVKFFKGHGLAKEAALAELKKLAREQPSSRGLLEFRKVYPAIFTTLESAFKLCPSVTRLAEQLHGMLRAFLTKLKAQSSHETTDQRQSYLMHHEHENRVARRESHENRLGGKRPKGGYKHEASKVEQQMVGEQVVKSMRAYEPSHLKNHLSPEELDSLGTKKLSQQGVRSKDKARDEAQVEMANKKAAKRKKPDKTVEDFKTEAEGEAIDNDADWVDFEQQQLNLRRKELSTQTFWKAQDKATLRRVYKEVFPQISEAAKDTKGAYIAVIAEFLKQDGAADRINLQAAMGIENDAGGSAAAQRTEVARSFFANSGETEVNRHYLEYCSFVVDEEEE